MGKKWAACRHYVLRYDKYRDVEVGDVGNCSPVILTDVMMIKRVYPTAALGSQTDCETE